MTLANSSLDFKIFLGYALFAMRNYFDLEQLQRECREKARRLHLTEMAACAQAGQSEYAFAQLTKHEPRISTVVGLCEWLDSPLAAFIRRKNGKNRV